MMEAKEKNESGNKWKSVKKEPRQTLYCFGFLIVPISVWFELVSIWPQVSQGYVHIAGGIKASQQYLLYLQIQQHLKS